MQFKKYLIVLYFKIYIKEFNLLKGQEWAGQKSLVAKEQQQQ